MKQFSSLHPIAAFTSSLKKIFLVTCFGLVSILGWSANISITSNTDWSTINSGSGPGGQPNASDNITVKNGAILTVDVNNALCGSFRIGDGNPSGGNGTLSFDANSQLTISGSFTIGGNQGGNQYTGSINMTNGGLLLIGSASISPLGGGLGTFTPGTGTIEYYLAGAQTVFNFGTAYNNLTLSGSGSKTTSTSIVINGVLSMEGTATASNSVTYGPNATLQYNTATARTIIGTGNNGIEWTTPFTATGGVVIANTGAITLSTNARSFNSGSKLTINAGATFSPGTPTTNTFFGGSSLIINGTLDFTAANGRILSGTSGTSTIIMGTTGLIRTLDPNGLGPNTNASFQTQPGGTWSDNIATVGTVEYYRNTATGVITDRDYNNLIITGTAFAKTWTLTANRNVAGTVTVSGTFTLANTGGPWTINVGGDWTNNGGTFTQSTATLNFNSTTTNQSINGTATSQSFNGITVNKSGRTLDIGGSTTTVTLNSASSVSAGTLSVPAGKTLVVAAVLSNNVAGGVSIAGTFRIDQGGFGGGTNDFTYISGSTLIYNYTQTSTYGPVDATHRYWPASGPTNVVLQMQNTAAINAGALQMGVPRTITGTLSTSNANTRTMTFDLNGNNFQAGALTVGTTAPLVIGSTATTTITGNVSINAALTINGDLYVGGNWTKASNAITFTPNGKAVFFNGTNNTQTIAITGAGTESFAYLVVDKATGGNLTLSSSPATNVTVNASVGDVLQIINAGGIDLNGQTLTLSGSSGNIRVTGGVRTITGAANSKLAITTGTKTVASTSGGTLELGANVTLETSTGINFGAGITTVKGTFRIISGGFASGNTAPIYDIGSTLEIANGGNFALYDNAGSNEAAGWFRNVASTGSAQQGIPWNFKVSGSGTNVFYNAVVDNLPRYVNGSVEIVTGNTFSLGGDLYLRGDFIRAGTFNAGSYRVTFNGANQATTGTITFTDLTLAGTGTKTFGAAVTVTGNLTINSGVIANLGTFSHTAGTMTMGGTGTPNGTHGSTSSAATYKNNTYFAATTGIITVGSSTCGVTANLPAAACRNTTITITGTNFTAGATNTVTFTGASGVASEVTTTATSLQVIIPSAATTGTITIVNGNGCSVTTASYTVNTAPSITGQPSSPTAVCAGTNSSNFTVTATGTSLTYQWQRGISGVYTDITAATTPNDGATYSNFNTATLTVANAPAGMNGYTYRVVVSGACSPSATSNGAATLTVNTAPNITGQPTSPAAVCAGTNSSNFTVTATGTSLTYQWQRGISGVYTNITAATTPNDGATYSNFNTATLTVTNAPAGMNGYTYRVVVSGTCTPAATSDGTATLTVNTAPNITGQPASPAAVCAGTNSSNFTVTATGTSLTYQWQRGISGVYTNITAATTPNDGATYSNFNTATLTVANATAGMNGYTYRVVVSGACTPSATSDGAATLTVNTAPNITGQPASPAAVCAGTNSSNFTVTATGTSLTYQWQRGISGVYTDITAATTPNDGATYSNFNTATLTVANAPVGMNGYTYRVVVSGACSPSATSNGAATLTVNTAPNITGQPTSPAAVCAGTNSSNFSVTATGTSLTYQWQRGISGVYTNITAATTPNDGATYSNFNTATLTVTNATAGMNGYTYRVVVSGTCTPAATSDGTATLTVNTAPNITGQPSSPAAVCAGTNSSNFTVTATGTSLTYQWQRGISGVYTNITAATTPNDGATYSNFTTATLTVANATASMNGYTYRVVVSGTCTPPATSNGAATLTVNTAPAITGQPTSPATVCAGTNSSSFSVTATGAGLTYQWQRGISGVYTNITAATTPNDGATYSNFNTATLTVTNAPAGMNGYTYRVVVSGTCTPSATSDGTATLAVNATSAVGAVSANQTICSGSSPADMTIASATGTIQWQRADNAAFTTNLTNVGTNSTTLTSIQTGGPFTATRYFRAVVTNGVCPSVTSGTITVTVNAPSAVGAVSADQTICSGSTPANMTIASATGTIQWQRADDAGFTTNLTNVGANATTLTGAQSGGAATITHYFRAIVTSGVCPPVTSATITVTVNATSAVGAVSANQTICSGNSPADMTIASATGTIQWQRADNAAFTTNLTNVGTNSTTLTSAQTGGPFTANRFFRAVVTNGVCPSVTSGTITVTVNIPSAVGAVSADQTICSGSTPANMTIASATGTIQWQRADDAGFTTNLTNVGTSSTTLTGAQSGGAATITHYFRAVVTSGVCPPVTSATITVTVNATSAVGAVSADQTICTNGTPADISIASATGTIQWQRGNNTNFTGGTVNIGSNSTTLTSAEIGALTATRYFRAIVTNGVCPSVTSAIVTVTVNPQPAGPGLNVKTPNLAAICTGQTVSATFNSGTGGVGCSDDYIVIIDGGSPVAYTPGSPVGGTATSSIVIQGRRSNCDIAAECNGTNYTTLASWTVNDQPVGPTLNVKTPNIATVCTGSVVSATFNAGSGGTGCADDYVLIIDGGAPVAYTPGASVGAGANSSIVIQGRRASCTAGAGCAGTGYVTLASWAVTNTNTWTGSSSNSWNDASNWSCSYVPVTSNDVIINNAGNPVLDVNYTVGGSFTMNATSTLTINPNIKLTISAPAVFNDQLVTIKSDVTGTGSIGQIDTVSNPDKAAMKLSNVTVERYIPGDRSWRLLTMPVQGTNTIRDAWANGKAPSNGPDMTNPTGRGTLITGQGYNSFAAASALPGWYDYIGSGLASSIRRYAPTVTGGSWPATIANTPNLTTTMTEAFSDRAYLLFIRGDRTRTTQTIGNPTTLSPNGSLNIGTISYAIPGTAVHKYEVFGNPYPATIDFEDLMNNAGNSSVIDPDRLWIWNPLVSLNGGYNLVKRVAGTWFLVPTDFNTNPGTANPSARYIQSSQGFIVEPITATPGVLQFAETNKADAPGTPPVVFDASGNGLLFSNLEYDNSGSLSLADGNLAVFADGFSKNVSDKNDVGKIINSSDNFGLTRDGVRLAMEAHPLVVAEDTLYYYMANTSVRAYALRFKAAGMRPGLTAILHDVFLNKESPVDLTDNVITTYKFAVTSNSASAATGRFYITFKANQVLPVTLTSARAFQANAGVQVDWQTVNEQDIRMYEVEKSVDGLLFTKAGTVLAANAGTGNYNWFDATPANGNNYYRIKTISNDGTVSYSQVMLVKMGANIVGSFRVYPNPLKGRVIGLQFTNMEKGQYTVKVFSQVGQLISSRNINLLGGSSSHEIKLDNSLSSGIYKLSLQGKNGFVQQETIVIQN